MSPLPAAATREQRRHRIQSCDFSEGRAVCGCGAIVTASEEPFFDRDEMLALAWQAHRREVGAKTNGEIGWDRTGTLPPWRLHR